LSAGSGGKFAVLRNRVHVNSVLAEGGRAIAEVPREHEGFTEGEPVWIHWHPGDELHFE